MADEDCAYFYKRAETELERAQRITDPRAVAVHYQLAEAYLERVASLKSDGTGGHRAS